MLTYKCLTNPGGITDASMMARLKELEEENRRLKKMYAEERIKNEIVQEALEKSGEAIFEKEDGQTRCRGQRNYDTPGMQSVRYQ